MEEISYEISDCSGDLGSYLDSVDYQPQELDMIEERLDLIYKLKRKYGNSIEEILQYLEKIKVQLDQLTLSEEKAEQLQAEYLPLKTAGTGSGRQPDCTAPPHGEGIFVPGKAGTGISQHAFSSLEHHCGQKRLEAGRTG